MAFRRGQARVPAPVRVRPSVFAVGRRVYVASGGDRAPVTLMDADKKPLGTVHDGTEVAILAWRPDWYGTTWYRIRTTAAGLVGWLPVGNLRVTESAASLVPAAAPPPAGPAASIGGPELEEPARLFGRR